MAIKNTDFYLFLRKQYKESIQNQDIGKIEILGEKQYDISSEYRKTEQRVCTYINDAMSLDKLGLFSNSSEDESIYTYTYLVMLCGFLDIEVNSKEIIASKLLESQLSDGFFYDKKYLNYEYIIGDGWGKRHFIPQAVIAIERLKKKPIYEFAFIEPFYNSDRMRCFLNSLDWNDAWKTSNVVMNITVCLQYVRDFMNCKEAADSVNIVQQWLLENIRQDCGMWYWKDKMTIANKYEAIRCAYHLYPLLEYDGIDTPFKEKAIDLILSMQNKYGGFDIRKNSSACEDIDAIDPLIRLEIKTGGYREKEVKKSLEKAFFWLKQNQMQDGGFVFRRGENFNYGSNNVVSKVNESNLFATWFRMLSICYIHDYLTGYKRNYMRMPGYEYPLYEEGRNDRKK